MTIEDVLALSVQGILVVIYVIGPPLGAAMAIGIALAILQAATQIQETSITFVPKLAAIAVTLIFTGRWAINHLIGYFHEVLKHFERIGG
ncbi:MAG: flagellar biosynthetic protein FliQ [Myxococcota bacterium]|jgi:flagellar biosynthetic protein FliQ|nr:flagellar biosynthetic protein FliQ [Myxococcota bacterium]